MKRRSTVFSSGIQEYLLCVLHSCRHTSICSISREADTEWCTYQCQDINPAVSLSCCYQFMSCENEVVTWADHHYLHWLYTLLHSCEVISFPFCRAHFKYTDSKKRGGCGIHHGLSVWLRQGKLFGISVENMTLHLFLVICYFTDSLESLSTRATKCTKMTS